MRLFFAAALAAFILGLGFTTGTGRSALAAGSSTIIANPDAFVCNQPDFIGFEDLPDAYVLSPKVIDNVQFTTPDWTVADFATGNYNGKYPNGAYTAQGTHEAWLPPPPDFELGARGSFRGPRLPLGQPAPQDDEFPTVDGRLDFVNGYASSFSLLVTTAFPVYLNAYNAAGQILATATATSNVDTGAMTELTVQDPEGGIAYVIVTGVSDSFAVDSFCTDAGAGLRLATTPAGTMIGVSGCGSTTPAALPAIFQFGTTITVTAVPCAGHVFLGWSGGPCDGTTTNPCAVPATFAGTMTANFSP